MASVLTEDKTAPPLRHGAIILARHGEPHVSRKVRLSASEYRTFWANYELLGLLPGQTPPEALRRFVDECGTLVSSTRLRAVESAQTLAGERVFERHELLIEAPLPPPNLPRWLRLSPRIWGFLARVWWWFFDHHEGQERRSEAEIRADRAAAMLIGLAAGGENVVVLAHGFFNYMIGRSLRRLGWRLVKSEGYKYWSMRRFERG
ncbi:MAG: histidine phosphatase family protein [Phenylobacterium sp.]|uniref:histidine phosphatase family protein n=1 Tax=Phenylobacterium sp. TaxID=1871053 RepID=UPI001A5B4365|nr:histidine phosphatase family protein [Phenylobacterium sp.]MBL8770653.1 histidine phosphatase family protein [Phenylobacterium sp.]